MTKRDLETYKAPTIVISRMGQRGRFVLQPGEFAVLLVRDSSPVVTVDEPGEWEFDVPAPLNLGKWPVACCTVRAEHIKAWLKLSPATVNKMLDRCERAGAEAGAR